MPTQAEDVAAIKAVSEKHFTATNALDATALGDLHTVEAIRMPPNEPAVVGKQAIRSWYQTVFEQLTGGNLTQSSEDLEVAGDWAYERGTYSVTGTRKSGAPNQDKGKYPAIYKRRPDNSWKIHRAIWNSDRPLSR